MHGEQATDRVIFAIAGADRVKFLQGLVTNDVEQEGLIYAALLTPQGKYLADFFLLAQVDCILLDVKNILADGLLQRLNMYKLRAEVTINRSDLSVQRGLGETPADAFADPRSEALGWRSYGKTISDDPTIDWDAIRVARCIPETGIELIANEGFILEAGFENLSGVDFKKGCYVGQEIVARMKHKTELRKGFVTVVVEGDAPIGTDILAEGRPVGKLFSQAGGQAIAYLRFDKAQGVMTAGDATVTRLNT
ncbi:MAG: CAF17-like 4Fe-4S cluster assembly/insertion protein YgfZ [Paracoccaceae bacterium]